MVYLCSCLAGFKNFSNTKSN
uniref:Uncharacterized protein n=1 Tax=Arundo donax TaxID=35708 RepID=A0A0A9C631_ARUDO